jgi:hypothetical protein
MIELPYGEIPKFGVFLQHFIRFMNKGGMYVYELIGGDADIALRVGVPVKGTFHAVELHIIIEKLAKVWNEEKDEGAGDLADSILQTLDFRWLQGDKE